MATRVDGETNSLAKLFRLSANAQTSNQMAVYMLFAEVPHEETRNDHQAKASALPASSSGGSSEDDRPLDKGRNRGKRNRRNEWESDAEESSDGILEVQSVHSKRTSRRREQKQNEPVQEARRGITKDKKRRATTGSQR